MSDLNDFFAKKDRKHKKKNAPKAAPKPAVEKEASAPAPPAAPVQSKADDGWIELDDPKSAKVNTGGRTVVEFKRDAEDKDSAVEGSAQGEKFGGWSRSEGGEGEGTFSCAFADVNAARILRSALAQYVRTLRAVSCDAASGVVACCICPKERI